MNYLKKSFAVKTIALFLALLTVFGITASAVQGDSATEVPVEIHQYELITYSQLLEEIGYSPTDINAMKTNPDGAISFAAHEFYAKKAGKGSIMLEMKDGTPFTFQYNVVENPGLMQKSLAVITSSSEEKFELTMKIDRILTDCGYTNNDVHMYNSLSPVSCSGEGQDIQFHSSGTGKGKIILNMKDGKTLLINVKVRTRAAASDIVVIFALPVLGPIMAVAAPAFLWPMALAPFLTPVIWAIGMAEIVYLIKDYKTSPGVVL